MADNSGLQVWFGAIGTGIGSVVGYALRAWHAERRADLAQLFQRIDKLEEDRDTARKDHIECLATSKALQSEVNSLKNEVAELKTRPALLKPE